MEHNSKKITGRSIRRYFLLAMGVNLIGVISFSSMLLSSLNMPLPAPSAVASETTGTTGDPCIDAPMSKIGVPPFKLRNDLGAILQQENNMTIGVELGVQRGIFSKEILTSWLNCEKYMLVDLWAHQENYKDTANYNQKIQDLIFIDAMEQVKPFIEKIDVCRNYTNICVKSVSDDYVDFIYVDARHDFKGVYEDMVDWWPKLRVGGIMAGHDYVEQNDGPTQTNQDWTTNYDGTVDETGTVVKGAVDKFAAKVCRQVTVSYRERGWNTWAMRK